MVWNNLDYANNPTLEMIGCGMKYDWCCDERGKTNDELKAMTLVDDSTGVPCCKSCRDMGESINEDPMWDYISF